MTESEYREKLKAHHICRDCKQTDAYTLAGRTYCAECAEKMANRKKEKRQESREEYNAQMAEYWKKLIEEKRCLHQKSVLQHHHKLISLHEGDDGLVANGNRDIAVLRRHKALPSALPALGVRLLKFSSLSQQHGNFLSSRYCFFLASMR